MMAELFGAFIIIIIFIGGLAFLQKVTGKKVFLRKKGGGKK